MSNQPVIAVIFHEKIHDAYGEAMERSGADPFISSRGKALHSHHGWTALF